MTEEQFGRIIDDAVEGTVKNLEDFIEQGMRRKGVRIFTRVLSFSASLVLIVGAGNLRDKGYTLAAKVCLIIGVIALIFEVIRLVMFERVKR